MGKGLGTQFQEQTAMKFTEYLQRVKLIEDVFAKNGELLAAVNPDTKPKASTKTSISTNLRPLGHVTGTTRGHDVYYAFSYKPSDEPGGSTELLKSLKGSGPFKLPDARRSTFIRETVKHMAKQFRSLRLQPDVIVTPQSSSPLLSDFANALADELDVQARKIGAFKKTTDIKLPDDYEAALKFIRSKYLDHTFIDQKFTGDEKARSAMERQLEQAIYRSIQKHGSITAKELPKLYGKFVKNIVQAELDDEYSLMDKQVMIVDDVLSSGTTMSDLFRAVNDLGAAKVWGAVLFARTSVNEERTD
jgi:adenine/guanine phosphoribosyltransferase-like PRPP-binding protein